MTGETADDHWASDPWFTGALDRLNEAREEGCSTLTLDLEAIEATIFNGDSAAHRLMAAMERILREESMTAFGAFRGF